MAVDIKQDWYERKKSTFRLSSKKFLMLLCVFCLIVTFVAVSSDKLNAAETDTDPYSYTFEETSNSIEGDYYIIQLKYTYERSLGTNANGPIKLTYYVKDSNIKITEVWFPTDESGFTTNSHGNLLAGQNSNFVYGYYDLLPEEINAWAEGQSFSFDVTVKVPVAEYSYEAPIQIATQLEEGGPWTWDTFKTSKDPADPADVAVIYLDGVNGDDTLDGKNPSSAVKTFAQAKALLDNYQNAKYIQVIGTVTTDTDTTLSLAGYDDVVVRRDPAFLDPLFRVAAGTLTVEDIKIDGNSAETTPGANVRALISVEESLIINNGAVLRNNAGLYEGAVQAREGNKTRTVTMLGGTIENNSSIGGAGVQLTDAVFTMSGGTIQNNKAIKVNDVCLTGGGVLLIGNSTMNLSGDAQILNNFSETVGGGIAVGYASPGSKPTLNMNGGLIEGNTAMSAGGGIYVQIEGVANVHAGVIKGNTAAQSESFGGGGIYVNGTKDATGVLYLYNAIVTENTATRSGGGYASCPSSKTEIHVTDGSAIYNNTASYLGNDLFIISSLDENAYGVHIGNPPYDISATMLGGTAYRWRDTDGNEIPLNKLKGTLSGEGNYLAWEAGNQATEEDVSLAKVFITGNHSYQNGGGIASNGRVVIGKRDAGLVDLSVEKQWEDQDNKAELRPDSIRVDVFRKIQDGAEYYVGYETISPDANGDWNLVIKNLPESNRDGNLYIYSIKENMPEDSIYSTKILGNQTDGFVIVNTISTPPPEETTGETETTPPEETTGETETTTSTTESPSKPTPPTTTLPTPTQRENLILPKTGESSLMAVFGLMSFLGAAATVVLRKKIR